MKSVYTGLALSGNGTTHLLYAANFLQGRIDVFDGTFKKVELCPARFARSAPARRFAPFGIQAINGDLYVTYAKQDEGGEEEVQGPSLGYRRRVRSGRPAAPPSRHARAAERAVGSLALAPESFGKFGGALLVGNLGDGVINAFATADGQVARLAARFADNKRLRIDGLWGIQFGNGILGSEDERAVLRVRDRTTKRTACTASSRQ